MSATEMTPITLFGERSRLTMHRTIASSLGSLAGALCRNHLAVYRMQTEQPFNAIRELARLELKWEANL